LKELEEGLRDDGDDEESHCGAKKDFPAAAGSETEK
jgi:hypothetical protein